MNREQIKDLFQSLAQSQGFYSSLLRSIEEATKEVQEQFWTELESKNFTDSLDVILYIET